MADIVTSNPCNANKNQRDRHARGQIVERIATPTDMAYQVLRLAVESQLLFVSWLITSISANRNATEVPSVLRPGGMMAKPVQIRR
jgi:hypothetical protein